jgi:excisionase family DNA binding protein
VKPRILSVVEAAERLQISPQRMRALIHAGRLPATRLGNRYVLELADVQALGRQERVPGRPLAASSAWALLAAASGRADVVAPSPRTGARLRRRHAAGGEALVRALRHSEPRSEIHAWRVLPADVEALRDGPGIVVSGLAADDPRIDVRYQPELDGLDGYVGPEELEALERQLLPETSSREANLLLRVPAEGGAWILAEPRAPLPVVAADLLGHADERVRRSATAVVGEIGRR